MFLRASLPTLANDKATARRNSDPATDSLSVGTSALVGVLIVLNIACSLRNSMKQLCSITITITITTTTTTIITIIIIIIITTIDWNLLFQPSNARPSYT